MAERLKDLYFKEIVPKLMGKFQYKNQHEVPRLEKIVINRGIGEASQNTKMVDYSVQELSMISGQKPIITRSKKSIAGFKLRENMPVGISVTLRDDQMYGFLDRFINLALPRIRDFQGINAQSLDQQGNYTIGLEEQLMFPEVDYEKIDKIRGMDISIVTTSKTKVEGFTLLKEFGMPFKNQENFEKTLIK